MELLRNDGKLVSILSSAQQNFGQRNQGINSYDLQYPDLLYREELTVLYRHNWLARRIVDVFPEDCTKDWIHPITFGDEDDEELPDNTSEYLKDIGAREMFRERDRFARLFHGGAFLFVGADDGRPLDAPLNENRIKTIRNLTVFDSYELIPEPSTDRFDPEFFLYYPAEFTFNRDLDNLGHGTRIHKSRLLTQLGKPTTHWDYLGDRQLPSDSVLQCVYKALVQYETASEHATSMLTDHDVLIHRINGLAEIIRTGKSKELQDHMQEVFLTLSMFNLWMQDGDRESSERMSHNFGGVSDTVGISRDEVTAATGIPTYKLWGTVGNAGLSDSGRAEERSWAAQVQAYQQEKYRPGLERLLELVFLAEDGPTNGEIPETWNLEFKSIYQPTPEEEAELRSKYATIDQTNINAGIYDGEEARQRYEGEEFKRDLILEPLEEGESDGLLPSGFGLPPNAVDETAPEETEEIEETEEELVEEEVIQDAAIPVLGTAPLSASRLTAIQDAMLPVLGVAPVAGKHLTAIGDAVRETEA